MLRVSRGLYSAAVAQAFCRVWPITDLSEPPSGRTATPHAFRHHFAYANIERGGREGRDVMAMLQYLTRYMGHPSSYNMRIPSLSAITRWKYLPDTLPPAHPWHAWAGCIQPLHGIAARRLRADAGAIGAR